MNFQRPSERVKIFPEKFFCPERWTGAGGAPGQVSSPLLFIFTGSITTSPFFAKSPFLALSSKNGKNIHETWEGVCLTLVCIMFTTASLQHRSKRFGKLRKKFPFLLSSRVEFPKKSLATWPHRRRCVQYPQTHSSSRKSSDANSCVPLQGNRPMRTRFVFLFVFSITTP